MCGIAGFTGPRADDALHAMVRALHHRGPDDSGVWASEGASLGMARLAVLDLSAAGHQPMAIEDGTIQVVYNGEVYNFAAERRALEAMGVRFRSTSDTEVVLRLYERYGDDFVVRLRGMLALAIWDRRSGPVRYWRGGSLCRRRVRCRCGGRLRHRRERGSSNADDAENESKVLHDLS